MLHLLKPHHLSKMSFFLIHRCQCKNKKPSRYKTRCFLTVLSICHIHRSRPFVLPIAHCCDGRNTNLCVETVNQACGVHCVHKFTAWEFIADAPVHVTKLHLWPHKNRAVYMKWTMHYHPGLEFLNPCVESRDVRALLSLFCCRGWSWVG